VQHTHLGHGSPTWSVRADTDAHVHLVCESCGGVLEAAASDILPLLQIIEADHGFLVDLGHLSLTGQCRECRTNGGLSPSPDRED
jgi:Fur family ferric uptake transcriptional regulator